MIEMIEKFVLPREVTYQCIWTVRDMKRLLELEALSDYKHGGDEIVLYEMGNLIVRESVAKRAREVLDAIRAATDELPEAYRKGIIDNIVEKKDFDVFAHVNTWQRWKQVFLYELARNLMLI